MLWIVTVSLFEKKDIYEKQLSFTCLDCGTSKALTHSRRNLQFIVVNLEPTCNIEIRWQSLSIAGIPQSKEWEFVAF